MHFVSYAIDSELLIYHIFIFDICLFAFVGV